MGIYTNKDHQQDKNFEFNNGFFVRLDTLVHGIVPQQSLDNPFVRFNENIDEYGSMLDDQDDMPLCEVDNFERQKPFMPKEKDVVGTSPIIPTQDTDEKLIYYDTQGESIYSNPPDPNNPVVDHGLDEDKIWAFRVTNYNQDVIKNDYALDFQEAAKMSNAPWWGMKLAVPAWYKDEKLARMMRQWDSRIKLQLVKLRRAIELKNIGARNDPELRRSMKNEIQALIEREQRRDAEY